MSKTETLSLREEKFFNLAFFALIAMGIIFRLGHYLAGRSLWLDEAMLAINILDRSFIGLTQQPMEYGQSSPIGFVFTVKTVTLLLGDSEYAFRLFSILAGCAALLMVAFLAKRFLNKAGTLIATALFASNSHLIYYSAETKQYMGDVAATLVLLFLFTKLLDRKASPKNFFLFGGLGAITLWFSHPAVFVAIGIGITLLIHYALQKNKKGFTQACLALAAWGISAISFYWFHLRHLSGSELLQGFWGKGFMPIPPAPNWFWEAWKSLLDDPLGIDAASWLTLSLFLLGIFFLLRRNWQFGAILIIPLVLAIISSGAQVYPFLGRMLLFAAPIFLIILGAGIDYLGSLVKKKWLAYGLMILLSGYLLYAPLSAAIDRLQHPLYREHIKPTMAYLREHIKDDDLIYLYYYAEPAFRFYAPKYNLDGHHVINGENHQGNPEAYLREVNTLSGNKRVWFVFSHIYERDGLNEKDFILDYLNQLAEKEKEFRVPGTSVSLYRYNLE